MKHCSNCNAENADYARFCTSCGHEFDISRTPDSITGSAAPTAYTFRKPVEPTVPPVVTPTIRPIGDEEPLSILIENDTPFNRQTLKDFYGRLKTSGIFILISASIMLLSGILLSILFNGDSYLYFVCAGIFAFLGVFFIIYQNKLIKNTKMVDESTHILFRFDENGFCAMTFNGTTQTEYSRITYDKITNVRDYKQYLLFRFGAVVLILNKQTFTVGSEMELKALLSRKCPKKSLRFSKK